MYLFYRLLTSPRPALALSSCFSTTVTCFCDFILLPVLFLFKRMSQSYLGTEDMGQTHLVGQNSTGPSKKGKRRRTKGKRAEKVIAATGEKFKIEFDPISWREIGDNSGPWANEIGQLVRQVAPMEIKRWSAVTKEQKMEMLLKMKEKFVFNEVQQPEIAGQFDQQLNKQWKDFRCYLHKYFENEGGNENPEAVKRKKHDEIESQSTWEWLCDFWKTDEFKARSRINKENRAKKPFSSRTGSRSMPAHRHKKRNLVTGQIIGRIELFHNTHWSAKEGWENNEAEARYNQMVEMRSSQVRSEDGVLLTEDQIVEKVLGARSGYIKLQGPLPKKGSKHIKSSTTTSDSNEIENAYKELQN